MKFFTHRKFDKAFKHLSAKQKEKFYKQIEIFSQNKSDKRLNNHSLTGKYLGYRSMNVTSDLRVFFEEINSETIKLVNIGTHSQLYG